MRLRIREALKYWFDLFNASVHSNRLNSKVKCAYHVGLMLVMLCLVSSSVLAADPIEIKFDSLWKVSTLPCRVVKYDMDITNNEAAARHYELYVDKYEEYVKFSADTFRLQSGATKRVTAHVGLPCSVSGLVEIGLNIKVVGFKHGAATKLVLDIESDYSREVSVMPLSVCRGSFGQGVIHVENPSATPNQITVDAELPRWMEMQANKATLPGNSQADFNFTVYPDSKLGEHIIGFIVKDFSGSEEIPFIVNIDNCENEFSVLDSSVLVVQNTTERLSIPVSGSGEFSLAVQGPSWVSLLNETVDLDGRGEIVFKLAPVSVNVSEDFDVVLLAKSSFAENDSSIVSSTITVSVTESSMIAAMKKYGKEIGIGLLVIGLLVIIAIYFKDDIADMFEKDSDGSVKIKRVSKPILYDELDFTSVKNEGLKLVKERDVFKQPWLKFWMKVLFGVVVVLIAVIVVIWKLGARVKDYLLGIVSVERKEWLLSKYEWFEPYKIETIEWWAVYWRYFALAAAVILVIIIVDQMRLKGYFKKVYDYFFRESE